MADVLGWEPWHLEHLRESELQAGEAYLRAREEAMTDG